MQFIYSIITEALLGAKVCARSWKDMGAGFPGEWTKDKAFRE